MTDRFESRRQLLKWLAASPLVAFVKNNHLDDELQAMDWLKFAGGYNGPGQAAAYAAKLSKAYAKRAAL